MKRTLHSAARRFAVPALLVLLSTTAAADSELRPFQTRLTLTESVTFTGTPCFAIGKIEAVGTSNPLGKVTATSQDCIEVQGEYDPNGLNSFSFSSGEAGSAGLVFTAANGDRLFVTYSGTLTAQPSGPHLINGHFTITGGTGRFKGATGGGTLSGYEDISQIGYGGPGQGQIEAVGTIATERR